MKETAHMVANLMAASARTAPKAGGKDFLEIVVITEKEDLHRIAEAMKGYAPKSSNEPFWLRDASNIENSDALVLVGLKEFNVAGYDCGACGHSSCADFKEHREILETEMGYRGPQCALRMMDIGVGPGLCRENRRAPQCGQPGPAASRSGGPRSWHHPGRGGHGNPRQHNGEEHLLRPQGSRKVRIRNESRQFLPQALRRWLLCKALLCPGPEPGPFAFCPLLRRRPRSHRMDCGDIHGNGHLLQTPRRRPLRCYRQKADHVSGVGRIRRDAVQLSPGADVSLLLVIRFLHGFATAIYGPVSMAVIADIAGSRKGEKLSWFSSVTIIGNLLGAPIGGFVLYSLSQSTTPSLAEFQNVYLLSGFAGVMSLLFSWKYLKGAEPIQRGIGLKHSYAKFASGIREVASDRRVVVTSSMEGLQNMTMGALEAFLPVYAVKVVGLNEFQAGLLGECRCLQLSSQNLSWERSQTDMAENR